MVADYAIRGSQTTAGGNEEPQIDGVLREGIYQMAQHEARQSLVNVVRGLKYTKLSARANSQGFTFLARLFPPCI
jgi:hypothetical protein